MKLTNITEAWSGPLAGLIRARLVSWLAARRSADLQSAVSPNCIRQRLGKGGAFDKLARLADWKSAIQQIANLRYSLVACVAALALAGPDLLHAADAPAASTNAAPAYSENRSFAQPIPPDPVGTNISVNRSFWGAPPPMPHSFPEAKDDGRFCLTCHAQETRIEKRQQAIAPVPHAEFSQCQQCHVPKGDGRSVFKDSEFVGLDYPGKGTRAHPYAPPTIPHKTFMRDNCLSCHGPMGKQKISSPHPYRSQCQQCHVSDASKNYDRPLPWKELDGKL